MLSVMAQDETEADNVLSRNLLVFMGIFTFLVSFPGTP